MIQKDIRDDIKIILSFQSDPKETPFKVSLFSLLEKVDAKGAKTYEKKSLWDKASWDGSEGVNVAFLPNNKVLVTFDYADVVVDETKFDKGWFSTGRLHGTVYISYPDVAMASGKREEMKCLNIPIVIVNKDSCNQYECTGKEEVEVDVPRNESVYDDTLINAAISGVDKAQKEIIVAVKVEDSSVWFEANSAKTRVGTKISDGVADWVVVMNETGKLELVRLEPLTADKIMYNGTETVAEVLSKLLAL